MTLQIRKIMKNVVLVLTQEDLETMKKWKTKPNWENSKDFPLQIQEPDIFMA